MLLPIPGGTSLFHDYLAEHGEGICSIASMFHEREHGDLVKKCFHDRFGLEVSTRPTSATTSSTSTSTPRRLRLSIESGSGHAIDFEGPARVFPDPEATFGPSPDSGITYRITQVTLVVNDLDAKVANYQAAFGWGPWRLFDTDQPGVLDNTTTAASRRALTPGSPRRWSATSTSRSSSRPEAPARGRRSVNVTARG